MVPTRKAAAWLTVVWLAAGSLFGQNLVETARREKARREASKKQTATAVTNADLTRAKKKPAMTTLPAAKAAAGEEEFSSPDQAPPSAVAAPSAVPAPQSATDAASESAPNFDQKKAELTTAQERAQERAELLDLKMRALNQQMMTFDSMATKDQIQRAIAETYQKLLDARAEAVKAKEALEKFLNQSASAGTSPLWIKTP
ncbi:MAG: hypothetical protein PHI34_00430 [Acidobacteriota bacterium]|nr:hypothetical protein [Acidobacteriota bacterium]